MSYEGDGVLSKLVEDRRRALAAMREQADRFDELKDERDKDLHVLTQQGKVIEELREKLRIAEVVRDDAQATSQRYLDRYLDEKRKAEAGLHMTPGGLVTRPALCSDPTHGSLAANCDCGTEGMRLFKPESAATGEGAIDHPSHYGGDTVYEAIKVIEAWELGFNLGNAVKYISRAGKKDKAKLVEDLEKAAWYLAREIERVSR